MPSAAEIREKELQGLPGRTDIKHYPFVKQAFICNITGENWGPFEFEFGNFTIQGAVSDEEYAVTEINDRFSVMDQGEKRVTRMPIGALDIALDLVRMVNENAGGGADGKGGFLGVFVCEDQKPTRQELAEAKERLREFDKHCVAIGDGEFAKFQRPQFIPDMVRRAVRRLKLEREYDINPAELVTCPGCAKSISPKAVRCPFCQAVLDEEKARKLYPQLYGGTAHEGAQGKKEPRTI